MSKNAGNYQADIHNAAYEAEYLNPALTADSLINSAGRALESLSGAWNFGVDWYDTCRRARWFREERLDARGDPFPLDWDWEAWERIKVPSCWNMERPELRYFEGNGVYTRVFNYKPQKTGERVFMRFEGAAYRASVFLNKTFIGTHDGASTPFNVEVTGLLQAENRVVVSVEARLRHDRIPMENTDWFAYGGIYRDIYLVRVPSVFIKDWFVRLVPDGQFSTIKADVYLSDTTSAPVTLSIPELNICQTIDTRGGKGSLSFAAKPELWSPQHPKCYTVTLSLPSGDTVSDRIGFREIKRSGTSILLNGEPLFLKGMSVHEDHILLGKTTSPEIIRATIRDLKALNGNYLRLAHYPHDARFAQIACEEGILLWEEIPVYWSVAFDNPATYRDAENQLAELILRDRNRASVILCSIGNENADTDDRCAFMSRLAKKAKALDDSRLVSAACLINHETLMIEDRLAAELDVIGINEYYGWYDPDFTKLPRILANSKPEKPVLICEFGGDARLGQRGTVDDLFSEDKQRRLYEEQTAVIAACPYIAGMTPWILYDFRCPRRLNRYQELFNRKGLIAEDRQSRKAAFDVLRRFYAGR